MRITLLSPVLLLTMLCSPSPEQKKQAAALNREGLEHFSRGNMPQAALAFAQAASLDRENAEYPNNAGMAQLKAGRIPQALKLFQEAIDRNEDIPLYHMNQSMALEMEGNLEGALNAASRAAKLDAQSFDIWLRLAILQQKTGKSEAALQSYQKARAIQDSAVVSNGLGMLAMASGDQATAEKEIRNAIRMEPGYAAAHYNLGVLFAAQKNYADAAKSFTTAAEKDPDDFRAYYNLALARIELGKKSEARQALQQYLKILPEELMQERQDAMDKLKALE